MPAYVLVSVLLKNSSMYALP